MIHANSTLSYHETAQDRQSLERRILGLMADGAARTDREIAYELGWPEPLRPRITNLVAEGLLHEVGAKECPATNRKVRLTKRFL